MGSADDKPAVPGATLNVAAPRSSNDSLQDEQVPSYQAVADQPQEPPAPLPEIILDEDAILLQSKDTNNMNYGFDVTESRCLAHLKLLHAIHTMKEDVGYSDGLWGIWDSLVTDSKGSFLDSSGVFSDNEKAKMTDDEERKMMLSKLREKRWAIFVARAVDRYEAWWNAQEIMMLTEEDMTVKDGDNYMRFPSTNRKFNWQASTMPPLGQSPLLKAFHRTDANSQHRRSHGHAHTHAEPSRVPGGYHAIWSEQFLGEWDALGADQHSDREQLHLQCLLRHPSGLGRQDRTQLAEPG